jgi:hypothetical protein
MGIICRFGPPSDRQKKGGLGPNDFAIRAEAIPNQNGTDFAGNERQRDIFDP